MSSASSSSTAQDKSPSVVVEKGKQRVASSNSGNSNVNGNPSGNNTTASSGPVTTLSAQLSSVDISNSTSKGVVGPAPPPNTTVQDPNNNSSASTPAPTRALPVLLPQRSGAKRSAPDTSSRWQLGEEVDPFETDIFSPIVTDATFLPVTPNGSLVDAETVACKFDVEEDEARRGYCLTIKRVPANLEVAAILQYFGENRFILPPPERVAVQPNAGKALIFFDNEVDYLKAGFHVFPFGQVENGEFYDPLEFHEKYYRIFYAIQMSFLTDTQRQVAAALKGIDVRVVSAKLAKNNDKLLVVYVDSLHDYLLALTNKVNFGTILIPGKGLKEVTVLTPRPSIACTSDPKVIRCHVGGFAASTSEDRVLASFRRLALVGKFDEDDILTFFIHRDAATNRNASFGFLQVRGMALVNYIMGMAITVGETRLKISLAVDSNKKQRI